MIETTTMHDSVACSICRGKPIDGSMSDEVFAAFLNACRDELIEKQHRFEKRIAGSGRWHYDYGSLVVGAQRFPMIPIGTHSSVHKTWMWAWANDQFPSAARDASRQFQMLHVVTGFQVFLDGGIRASTVDAQDFSALAIHQVGGIGMFSTTSDGLALFLAVLEPTA
jgi:hypothetical protein